MDAYCDEFDDADIEAELERELAALGEITAEEIAEAQRLMGDGAPVPGGGGYESGGYLRPMSSYEYATSEEDAAARAEQQREHARACEEARLAIASLSGITVAPLEDAQLPAPTALPMQPHPAASGPEGASSHALPCEDGGAGASPADADAGQDIPPKLPGGMCMVQCTGRL
jgi:hypothetical protein